MKLDNYESAVLTAAIQYQLSHDTYIDPELKLHLNRILKDLENNELEEHDLYTARQTLNFMANRDECKAVGSLILADILENKARTLQ